jgi:hypothetical protein
LRGARFANRLQAGEVNDGVNIGVGKHCFHGYLLHEVHVVELGGFSAELGDPAQ